jgi:hypothetical protein
LDDLRALSPAPSCLAGARLDLNRAEALRQEIERTFRKCIRQAPMAQMLPRSGQFRACLDARRARDPWVLLPITGESRPLLFERLD